MQGNPATSPTGRGEQVRSKTTHKHARRSSCTSPWTVVRADTESADEACRWARRRHSSEGGGGLGGGALLGRLIITILLVVCYHAC
eukprot:2735797-Alexandrium_andersonii.AAC.1